jgi:hypothetical protein
MIQKTVSLLVMLFFGMAGCSKGPASSDKPSVNMDIPKGLPGGPQGNPADPLKKKP